MSKEFLRDLNKEQREAATTLKGFVRILAGAGSGKTKTLIARTANLLDEGVNPQSILLLTFTKQAALEMKIRLCSFPSISNGNLIKATTFHAFCADLLHHYATAVGFPHNFDIRDPEDTKVLIHEISEPYREDYKAQGYNVRKFPTSGAIMDAYSLWRNSMSTLGEAIDNTSKIDSDYADDVHGIIMEYVDAKIQRGIMDYDDLLYYFHKMLIERSDIRTELDQQYQYIMCDEYQDTNVIQDAILDLLSRDEKNLCIVGDDNQSIYAFRCAHVENIINFEKKHPTCTSVSLLENYRSSQEILNLSNAVMSHARFGIKKVLRGQFHGNKPLLVKSRNSRKQAEWICQRIQNYIDKGVDPKEIAVMVRNGNLSVEIELECTKRGIDFVKHGGLGFFQQKSVRDVLSFCRMAESIHDELAWKRVLTLHPYVANKTSMRVFEDVKQNGRDALIADYISGKKYASGLKSLKFVLDYSDGKTPKEQIALFVSYYKKLMTYNIKKMNVSEDKRTEEYDKLAGAMEQLTILEGLAEEYVSTKEMLEDFVLNVPEKKNDGKAISITTIHSAKGLEYEIVFLVNPVDGIFPRGRNIDEWNEELRCLYVAITRPKKELFVCIPDNLFWNGTLFPGDLSKDLNRKDVLKCMDEIRVK